MTQSNHILGILGGMGPQASNTFYQRIIARTDAQRDQDHLRLLLWSDAAIPDRTAGILSGQEGPVYDALLRGIQLLTAAGCTLIAIPCNTSHYFVPRLQKETPVPILHMIQETAAAVKETGAERVGVLATDGTIQTGLYQTALEAVGCTAVTPPPGLQKTVMSLIYDDIKSGKPGDEAKFAALDRFLHHAGCGCAILGCTELSVYREQAKLPPYYIDAMEVLAQQAILRCGKALAP
ncbi:MAG: aspartate/glutamate racemase family protein [Ruminiclostridium sp.]|jgi:aspartate racemase|nr:aspartate/glutamate racemase family protein [Ruminiclostridium sp.]